MMTYVENLATQSNANIKDVSELYCVASKFGSKSIVCVTDNMQMSILTPCTRVFVWSRPDTNL